MIMKIPVFSIFLTLLIIGIGSANALPQPIIDIPMNTTLTNFGSVTNTVTPSQSTNYQAITGNAGINFNTGYYLQLADKSQYDIAKTDPLTIQFAFKDTYQSPLLVARSSVNYAQGYSVEMYNGQLLWNIIGTWGTDQVTVGTNYYLLNDNKLHFVTVTKSSGNPFNICIYDNSTQISCTSGSISGTISTTNPLSIGAGLSDMRQIQGQMALFKMYNMEFSQNNVTNSFVQTFNIPPHTPQNYTKTVNETVSISDSITAGIPTPTCTTRTTSTLNYTILQSNGKYLACNLKTNNQDYSDSDIGNAINYAINHLDSNRNIIETVNINASTTNLINPIWIANYTHIHFNNSDLKVNNTSSLQGAILHFPGKTGQHNVVVDGNATLDCGNTADLSGQVSGTYLVNGYNISMSGLNITNCNHVGFYWKGWSNFHIFNINISHIISHTNSVGTGYGGFGGNNGLVENMTVHDVCGPLGHFYQVESNDESLTGPDYQTNVVYQNISGYNACGAGFYTTSLGTNVLLTSFHFQNTTWGISEDQYGNPLKIQHGEISDSKLFGSLLSASSSNVKDVHYWNDPHFTGKAGIVFTTNAGGIVDHSTFSNIPLGVDVAANSVSITNNCFNVPQQYKVEPGVSQPTVSNNVC